MWKINKLVMTLVLGTAVVACGTNDTSSMKGATSSSGLVGTLGVQSIGCFPSGVADAGYNIYVTKEQEADGYQAHIGEIWIGGIRNERVLNVGVALQEDLVTVQSEGFKLSIDRANPVSSGYFPAQLEELGGEEVYFSAMLCELSYDEPEYKAVRAEMYGMGPAVDQTAFSAMLQVFGDHVASGVVASYQLGEWGIEGGASACAELSPFAPEETLEALLEQLNAIEPNRRTTSYEVRATLTCD